MSVTVRVYEAKALKNLDGSVKCSARIKDGSRESPVPVYTPAEPESSNPVWREEPALTLDTYGFDLNYAVIVLTVLSGGENVGSVELALKKVLDNPDDYAGLSPKLCVYLLLVASICPNLLLRSEATSTSQSDIVIPP
jgi:hypothetical protein